jgi:hypothetical protein
LFYVRLEFRVWGEFLDGVKQSQKPGFIPIHPYSSSKSSHFTTLTI